MLRILKKCQEEVQKGQAEDVRVSWCLQTSRHWMSLMAWTIHIHRTTDTRTLSVVIYLGWLGIPTTQGSLFTMNQQLLLDNLPGFYLKVSSARLDIWNKQNILAVTSENLCHLGHNQTTFQVSWLSLSLRHFTTMLESYCRLILVDRCAYNTSRRDSADTFSIEEPFGYCFTP